MYKSARVVCAQQNKFMHISLQKVKFLNIGQKVGSTHIFKKINLMMYFVLKQTKLV